MTTLSIACEAWYIFWHCTKYDGFLPVTSWGAGILWMGQEIINGLNDATFVSFRRLIFAKQCQGLVVVEDALCVQFALGMKLTHDRECGTTTLSMPAYWGKEELIQHKGQHRIC